MAWQVLASVCMLGSLMQTTVDGKVCGDDLARYAFTVLADKFILKNNYQITEEKTEEECMVICAKATWDCRSFDYSIMSRRCYLQKVTMQSPGAVLKEYKGRFEFRQVHCEVTYLRSPSSSPVDIHQPANFKLEVLPSGMKTYKYGVATENAWNGALKDVNSCAVKCSKFVNEKGNCMKFTFSIDDSKCYLFNAA
ncbi:uncharacterized protein LOC135485418 [Lineus longissimus]|uniref:uncharacterized protein LOC135485418 n=1 Tax=Lineus longissimus TaxID=88925 RepID=UPI002B4F6116